MFTGRSPFAELPDRVTASVVRRSTGPVDGRSRDPCAVVPLTTEERQFIVALVVMLVGLGSVILTGLLMAEYVWI